MALALWKAKQKRASEKRHMEKTVVEKYQVENHGKAGKRFSSNFHVQIMSP
jgi:uncharacterized protein YcgI (DUF1989 family)